MSLTVQMPKREAGRHDNPAGDNRRVVLGHAGTADLLATPLVVGDVGG
jgi:hypothetical protein